MIDKLLQKYPLASNQVNKDQVRTILTELERVIDYGAEGDVVEFGCYIGTTSIFLQRLLLATSSNKTLHVYDSFEGLPPKTDKDASVAGDQFAAGELAVSKKQFVQTFAKAGVRQPIIHKSWFNELTQKDIPQNIAFAFLDGDFYSSIHDSLKLVLPRLTEGAVVVVDDYAREALPGAAKALHELLPHKIVTVRNNLGILQF
ncbi:MAG: TylF/MycF/NovP-related O-methyltransferase [Candidatus Saccharimonadales bacterium]